jgi:hypothetical protein
MKRTSPDEKTSTSKVAKSRTDTGSHGRRKKKQQPKLQVSHGPQQGANLLRGVVADTKKDIDRLEEHCVQLENAQFSLAIVHIQKVAKNLPSDSEDQIMLLDALDNMDRKYTSLTNDVEAHKELLAERIEAMEKDIEELLEEAEERSNSHSRD